MTLEERAKDAWERASVMSAHHQQIEMIADAIREAIREERERCARIVRHEVETMGWVGVDAICAAIRKGEQA
jgi:archaellum component FlaC